MICYTGEPRLSGTNNWEIVKRHIDGDPELFQLFEGIRDSALAMRAALLADDWQRVRSTMRAAYPNRKRLAPGITTHQMETLVEKALANGAEAAKVCGAGGGGCVVFLCEPGAKQGVSAMIEQEGSGYGVRVLPVSAAPKGVTVKASA